MVLGMSETLNWGYNDYMNMNMEEFMFWVEKLNIRMGARKKDYDRQLAAQKNPGKRQSKAKRGKTVYAKDLKKNG